jgi:TolB-like protein/DNA-binding winged helix-turn-helix (wHTH) protein
MSPGADVNPRPAHVIYEFGEFRLDALRRMLTSRSDGQPLQVTGKVFDTLLYLVERAGQVLDKRTLLDALWPDVVVEESNLTQTIHTLRRALGERPDDHRFIVTVPGRGYRFVAVVTTSRLEELPPAKRKPLAVGAALVATALAGVAFFLLQGNEGVQRSASFAAARPSIAVLPFVDMSETQDQEYFAEGLSEEILNVLAQSTTLQVTARTSSFSFRGRNVDIPTIASALNVTHVLEGSVRKAGNRVRITAQLVDGSTSVHSWSHTYDRDVTDLFSVQDDIAVAVAEALHATLTGNSAPGIGQTNNAQAFERYLQGRYFFNRRGVTDVARAREYFQQALRIDPGYARAWAGLAGVYYLTRQDVPQGAGDAWGEAVGRALRLGRTSPSRTCGPRNTTGGSASWRQRSSTASGRSHSAHPTRWYWASRQARPSRRVTGAKGFPCSGAPWRSTRFPPPVARISGFTLRRWGNGRRRAWSWRRRAS